MLSTLVAGFIVFLVVAGIMAAAGAVQTISEGEAE